MKTWSWFLGMLRAFGRAAADPVNWGGTRKLRVLVPILPALLLVLVGCGGPLGPLALESGFSLSPVAPTAGERVDLAGFKLVAISCSNLQDIWPNSSGDNAFTVGVNPDGVATVLQVVKGTEWALIDQQTASAEGVGTAHLACSGNPGAWNFVFQSGSGNPPTFNFPSAPNTRYALRRSGNQVWLTLAGAAAQPQPPAPPPPPPSNPPVNNGPRVVAANGNQFDLQVHSADGRRFSLGAACGTLRGLEVKFWQDGSGAELFGSDSAGRCQYNAAGVSGVSLSGGTFSGSFGGACYTIGGTRFEFWRCDQRQTPQPPPVVTPPQPPSRNNSCGIDKDGNGFIDDVEAIASVASWTLGGLTDQSIICAVRAWSNGRRIDDPRNFAPLAEGEWRMLEAHISGLLKAAPM